MLKIEGAKLCNMPKVRKSAVFFVLCIDFSKRLCYIKGAGKIVFSGQKPYNSLFTKEKRYEKASRTEA